MKLPNREQYISATKAATSMTRQDGRLDQSETSSARKRKHSEYVDDALQQALETTNKLHSDDSLPAPHLHTSAYHEIVATGATPDLLQSENSIMRDRGAVKSPEQRYNGKDMPFLRPPPPQAHISNKMSSESYTNDASQKAGMTRRGFYPPSETSIPVRSMSRSSVFGHHDIRSALQRPAPIGYPQLSQSAFTTDAALFPRTSKAAGPRSTMPSPFFNSPSAPYSSFATDMVSRRAPASRLATAAMDFQVQPVGPRRMPGTSLNSLSFMHNPYTSHNQPIFYSAPRKHTMHGEKPFATPAVVGSIRGAKAGEHGQMMYGGHPETSYRMNSYGSRYPEPSRGLFSSAGRRIVRR